ncbi:MAG: response regulator, partial [Deltaproteobacteria bacterium]|nr:response regulator [Deltaproteobacteria bacterium]
MDNVQSGEHQPNSPLLIVDDEPGIRKVLAISLADEGYTVLTAQSGEEALEIFRDAHPAIVLTDIKMPGMDGIELLKIIKSESPHTEVIMITGHGDMELAIESIKHDAIDFVTKPIIDAVLAIALKRANEKIFMRRKLQAALTTSQQRYGQLFDEVPCYISVQDREFRLTDVNKLFKKDFGDRIGAFCHEVYKHLDAPCPDCPIAKTFKDGRSYSYETVVRTKDGQEKQMLVSTAAIRNADGDITRVMEMSTDITEVRRLKDHLSSLGLLMGSVSHGLKGLLTGLDGGMYIMDAGFKKKSRDQIDEGRDIIRMMVERIRSMIQDILYYAK